MLTFDEVEIVQGDFSLSADFSIEPGAMVSVIGPSGAGKSTLLSALAGFVPATSGRILWEGVDITKAAPAERPLAMVFQDSNLFPHLTVAQNVGLGVKPSLKLSAQEHTRVAEALARVGLSGFEARKPAALSGGQQSRVALARVLLRDKPVMVLDEPFAALGPALRVEMLALMVEIAEERGLTVLMVTHDPKDARQLDGSTILVADGIAHAPVPTGPFLDTPPEALRAYLGG
ncbi:thiamine transport system ATP-binding protein [Litoreibacter halocynthiae]|uniref:Thiamine transport system ATP-binding protein n=1 Tax=Litoreibacter halocynthiae TaxID=1242689 RepID=A0A4R7LCD7_9RHOB|nr:ATP-binding cassette domain-containing protein [Litoreibacter halocynthiae]TDT73177.1 thiamine transport system ATP-binding protein [Litoreibacter halocynthiae]